MAGSAQTLDATALARKYRGKGQSDEQVYNTLRSLGLNAKDARAAVGPTSSTQGKAPVAAPAGPAAPTSPPANGGGSGSSQSGLPGLPSMPSFSAPTNITLTPPRKLSSGDVGGFLAGLLLYVLALNYLTHGTEGVKGWFSAKFLNEPAELNGAKGSSSSGGAASDGGLVSTKAVVAPLSPLAVPDQEETAYDEEYAELLEDEGSTATRGRGKKRKLRASTEGRRNPGKAKGGGRGGRTAADGRRGVGPRAGDVRRGAQAARSPVKKVPPGPVKKTKRR